MSLNPDVSTALVTQFAGSSNSADAYQIDAAHGLYAQNTDYVLGPLETVQAQTRRGTSQIAQIPTSDGAVVTMTSWTFAVGSSQESQAVYYAPAVGVRAYSYLLAGFSVLVMTQTGAAWASFALNGTLLYAAFCDSSGHHSTVQAQVYAESSGANDTLFSQGITTAVATVAVTQPSSGTVTQGTHRIGYIFTTRTGYTGVLNPVSSGIFTPSSFTANGTNNVNLAVDFLSMPGYLNTGSIQVVMTTAANLNRYYLVPGTQTTVGATGTYNITFNITDGDLTATGTDVTQNQNLLAQIAGSGPFNPWAISTYSSRMSYCTLDSSGFGVVYFSDQNNYQSLTAAFHGIYLEGRQTPVQTASIGGTCYIATLQALYSTSDNGNYPATWTPPAKIDGSVGILAPSCILSGRGKLLIASEKGLYVYRGGAFPQIPMSYWQGNDWNRINWAAPTQVQIVDDPNDVCVRVLAPLNVVITGATNTNPITITTAIQINGQPIAYPHLFQSNLSVTISGVLGNTAANGTWTITKTGENTFTIPTTGNGAYTSGGLAVPQTPNAVMTWAYPQGDSPGQPYYSLHGFGAFRTGAIAMIRNLTTQKDETWYAPSGSNPGGILRRVQPTDALVYRDQDMSGSAAAINSFYETAPLPLQSDEAITVHDYNGAHLRISGNGNLAITAYGLDHVRSVIPLASPVALSGLPGLEYLVKWALRNEQQSVSFGTNAVDAYFIAALLRCYYTNSLPMR